MAGSDALTCPSCGATNSATSRFCGGCGAAVSKSPEENTCSRCRMPNPPGAKFCNQCGGRLGTRAWEDEGKERRVVTVLFADVSGFTQLAERMDPEEVEERIRACWARLSPVIEKHGGYVDKYIGDAVMVLFGAPLAHEDDPERAVRCALALHTALRDDRLRLRIGVHTGEVIVGSVSDRGDKDYTAMGDTVNTASRLHTLTTPGKTVISAATQKLTGGRFAVNPLDPVRAKGKSDAIPCFEVVGPAARIPSAGEATRFVGRREEIARLDQAFERARAGKTLTVLAISGAPGVGKARLVAEWRGRLERRSPGAIFMEGEAVPYGGEPGRAVRQAVLGRYGDHSDPAEILRALAEDLEGGDRTPELSAGFIGRLFGIETGTRVRHLDPRDVRAAAFAALDNLLVSIARRGPVVLTLHELQWADSGTIDFIGHLLKSSPPAPILLLAVARSEAFQEQPSLAEIERLELGPLSQADTGALARALLGGREVPRELEELIHRRTEGNAFFIEETLRSLVDDGALVDDQEVDIEGIEITMKPARSVRLARPLDEVKIPQTVQGVIASRIDALSEEARKVLKAAAVAGRTFSRSLLDRVLGHPVANELDEIRRREMIQERPPSTPGDREYAFAHPLIPEVAYREILRRNRKALHRGIAEALEERLAGRRTPDLLVAAANHYEKAEVHDRAVTLFLEAADRARQVFANQEAISCYTRVLAMAERPEALQGRAEVYKHLGRNADALADFRRLREVWERAGDRPRRRASENGIAHTLAYMERYDEAAAEAGRVAAEANSEGDPTSEALALNTLGYVHVRCRREAAAEEAWRRSEAVSRAMGDRRAAAAAVNNLGLLQMRRGDMDGARSLFEESITLEREVGNRVGVIGSLTNLAEVHTRQKRYAVAIETYQEAIRLAREIGLKYALGVCLNNLANIHAMEMRYAEALEIYGQALSLRREMGDRIGVATTLANTGIVRHLLGDYSGAAASLDRALDLARAIRQPRTLSYSLDARGNLSRMLGDFTAAERDHREAIAADPARTVEATYNLALDFVESGRPAEACALAVTLPPAESRHILAVAGERDTALSLLTGVAPVPDQTCLVWSAAAAAIRHAPAAEALRRLAADLEARGLTGVAWRVRADLATVTAGPADAAAVLREADRLAGQLPEDKRRLFVNHPALVRVRSLNPA